MSLDSMFQKKKEDTGFERLIFPPNYPINCTIKKVEEFVKGDKTYIKISTIVNSGEHKGKWNSVFISTKTYKGEIHPLLKNLINLFFFDECIKIYEYGRQTKKSDDAIIAKMLGVIKAKMAGLTDTNIDVYFSELTEDKKMQFVNELILPEEAEIIPDDEDEPIEDSERSEEDADWDSL